jgi:hypothetical protein
MYVAKQIKISCWQNITAYEDVRCKMLAVVVPMR